MKAMALYLWQSKILNPLIKSFHRKIENKSKDTKKRTYYRGESIVKIQE